MRVRSLIKLLMDCEMDAAVVAVNQNGTGDEFMDPTNVAKLVTDAMNLDDGSVVIYFAGEPSDSDDADAG
jgi:hypothetical protein